MKKQKKIGLDFDDVIFSFNQSYLDYHNKIYNTNLTYDKITEFDLSKVWNIPVNTVVERIGDFYRSGHHDETPPIHGAVDAIQSLMKDYDIHIITSRPEFMREATSLWLKKYLPELADKIHFTNHFSANEFTKNVRNKSDVCKELGIGLFVEDASHYAMELQEKGIKVILFDKAWNRKVSHTDIVRLHSWDDILEYIQKNH